MKVGHISKDRQALPKWFSHVLPPRNAPRPFKWVSRGSSPNTLFSASSSPLLGKGVRV